MLPEDLKAGTRNRRKPENQIFWESVAQTARTLWPLADECETDIPMRDRSHEQTEPGKNRTNQTR